MEFIAILCISHFFFLYALKEKNFAVMDIGWGLFFASTAILSIESLNIYKIITCSLVVLWAIRLSVYLFLRNHRKPEDYRYKEMREDWKPHENLQAYFKVFLFQGFLSFIISLSFWNFHRKDFTPNLSLFIIGALIFIFGLIWESWADYTMAKFKKDENNKGSVCTKGPWKFSRHPNYFGEITLWWGMYIMCFDINNLWTIIAPLTIHLFILNVSGVPLLEKKMKSNPKYEEYIENTNSMIPKFF